MDVSLPRYILRKQRAHPGAIGDLSALLMQISEATKMIARELGRAALAGTLGAAGSTNVQGEQVKKLDVIANDIMVDALAESGLVATLVSEEIDEPIFVDRAGSAARYAVCFDPVDGSSNLDVNGVVGTIFSVLRRVGTGRHDAVADVLQPGSAQVAAGYVMYGPSTVFVYTARDGVHGFTLDPTVGEFFLSHEGIRIPERGRTYSVNEGNFERWQEGTRRLVKHLRAIDRASGRPYSMRYAGSLVADFHRTLLEGGLFLYPADDDPRRPSGKLRLLYEAAPLALVVEEAGGAASTGTQRILDVVPTSPHQRVPLVIGSPAEVALAEEFYRTPG